MASANTPDIEAMLLRGLVLLSLLSGGIVAVGFFFPQQVGDTIDGVTWLTLSLLFFGSLLGAISLLPFRSNEDKLPAAALRADQILPVRQGRVASNLQEFLQRQDSLVFWIPIGGIALFLGLERIVPTTLTHGIERVERLFLVELGWLFAGIILVTLLVSLALLIGPWGDRKLGGEDAEPTYSIPVYFTMFFTAGIAAGIVFWGPAESLFHYESPAPFFAVESGTDEAATAALATTLFHWGISAWSAYIVLGLPIAYFVHQHGAPLRVSALITPIVGIEGTQSIPGKLVDILAIFATIGGIATSIALLSEQFLTGITFQWGVEVGWLGPLVFVTGLGAIAVISAQSGVHRGIRRIAAINIGLFFIMVLVFAVLGPRGEIGSSATAGLTTYASSFVPMSLSVGEGWIAEWTMWNWAWWFSWAPFAGLFLAALSRGRRIRTVIITGLLGTAVASIVWFLLVGGTALHLQSTSEVDLLRAMANNQHGEAIAGFPIFEWMPLSRLLTFLFLGSIIVFMASSADTSTLIVSILASRERVAPTTGTIILWGGVQVIVAIAVILTASAQELQTAAVLTGGPFAALSIVAIAGLLIALSRDQTSGEWLHRRILERIRHFR